jgi:hypothetical protein
MGLINDGIVGLDWMGLDGIGDGVERAFGAG